jgi:hypothetical protein
MGKVIVHNSTGRSLWIRLKARDGANKVVEATGDSLVVVDVDDGETTSMGIFNSLDEAECAFGACVVVPPVIVPHRSEKR